MPLSRPPSRILRPAASIPTFNPARPVLIDRITTVSTNDTASAPRYAQLADVLRESLRTGKFKPGELIGTEHDLVRQHGVSRVTVRKATELLIADGLIERRAGKGLFSASQRDKAALMIQVVVGNMQWVPCMRIARGAQLSAGSSGVQVQIYDAHGNLELDLDMLRRLPDSGARGAIIHALYDRRFAEALYGLHIRQFPFVLVDQRLHDIDVPSVLADNHTGGYQLGQHLLSRGHKRIAFIGDLGADTVRDRLAGLRAAIDDAGLPFDRSLLIDVRPADQLDAGGWTSAVEEKAGLLVNRPDRPTAIFADCDAIARDVCQVLERRGLNVPNDCSVVGFDDDPLAQMTDPPLTTVRQPFEDMGRAAFEVLTKRMNNGKAAVEHRILPVTVVERASTAHVRA